MLNPDGAVREWIGTLDDIHERRIESEKREIVVGELRHRLKNLMAIVEALAKYSAPRPGTDAGVDSFLKRFTGRLHALTAASDLLLAGHAEASRPMPSSARRCSLSRAIALPASLSKVRNCSCPKSSAADWHSPSTSSRQTQSNTARCRSRRDRCRLSGPSP